MQVEDIDKKKLVLQKNSKELKSFKSFEEEINSAKDSQQKNTDDEEKETKKAEKKTRKLPIETPGQPKIASVDTWTQGPENANQIHTQRKFNIKTPGQVRDDAKFVDDRKFQKFEGTIQISADPKKVKSLLSKHKVKISGKEKDLFLPRGMMDLSITGDDKSLKAFAKDFYSEGKDNGERKKTAYGGQDPDIKDRPGTQPAVYYQKPGKGDYSKATKLARARHFDKGSKKDDDDPSAYKPAPGDATGKTKPSRHTQKFKKMFGDDVKEEIKDIKTWSELPETIEQYKDEYGTDYRVKLDQTVSEMFDELLAENEGVKKKAEKSGMPYGILMKVYNRGMAAWRTGHRPGTTPQQWGMARVNSFVTKSSGTWGKADKDLAAKVRG